MNAPMLSPARRMPGVSFLAGTAIVISLLIFLIIAGKQNFRVLIIIFELAGIAVAIATFSLVWNARWNEKDSFLAAVGLSFLATAVIDAFFLFTLIDSPLLGDLTFDNAIQLWIAARYLQCFTLLVAFLLIGQNLTEDGKYDAAILALPYAAITAACLFSILVSRTFPVCDTGFGNYTGFKIASEVVISAILVLGLVVLVRRRNLLDAEVWQYLVLAQVLLVFGEISFAVSVSNVELTNFLGFFCRFVSIYFIYRAIVVIGIARPIDLLFSELQQHERALQLSEQRYRNVVEYQTELISRFRPDGTHVFVNDAYCRFFGMTREDILGKPFHPTLPPEENDHIRKILGALSKENPVITDSTKMILPDGSTRWVLWNDRAIFDAEGNVIEYQSVGRDITKYRKASDAFAFAHKKLVLLSGITRHDIVNQLTALRSYIALLSHRIDDPAQKEYLDKMEKISGVIAEQISFTRDYEEMGMDAPVWQDLARIASKAVSELSLQNVKAEIDLDRIEVFADPLLERVFYNLIDNALRYGGGSLTRIRFSAHTSGDRLIVVTEDDGAGISGDTKEHIFEKGFGNHTGLGLFLVREILSITGITIRETGTPGHGARFEIEIPRESYRFRDRPEEP